MENLKMLVVMMKINKRNIIVEPLFKNHKKKYICSSTEESEVVLVF
jgi:hypothetical protein